MQKISLIEKIKSIDFQPEVYIYPTPRAYSPIEDIRLSESDFSEEMNIYIHIPFCRQICSFCGYLKIMNSKGIIPDNYVEAVIREMKIYKNILQEKKVRTLHFGGGTPSLLSATQLERMIDTLISINPKIMDTAIEVSIESTPENIDEKKFSQYRELGINRVSMGIQTLDDNEISLSRRKNTANISVNAIEKLRKVGIPNIVADLMIGIEGQTVESFESSVEGLLGLRLETVELYALGIMPQTTLGRGAHSDLMRNQDIYRCYDLARELFLKEGYIQDCHNRYIIPNKGSFLQEDYVWKGMSLIGFGAGARSYANNIHYRNTYDANNPMRAITKYLNIMSKDAIEDKTAIESGTYLDADELMRQYVIGNIESLDKNQFAIKFKQPFEKIFSQQYKELSELKLITEDEEKIILNGSGLNFRDLICTEFFSEKIKMIEYDYRRGNHGG